MQKVIVVAVHPDDETLGCGGTLLRHKAEGDEIFWLLITAITEESGFSSEKVKKRKREIASVAEKYGFTKMFSLDLPTTALEEQPKGMVISKIAEVFTEVKPDIVYLPFYGDAHSDHHYTFECAYACTKTFRFPFIKEVYLMETLSETDFAPALQHTTFHPNHYVDISDYVMNKIEIMKEFESEIGIHPFPRSVDSIQAMTTLRGSQAGVRSAEAFMLLKKIR